jgi:pilus assembly protein CpaF
MVFAASIFIIIFSLSYFLLSGLGKKDWLVEIRKLQKMRETGLTDSLQRWILQAEKEMGKTGVLRSISNRRVFLLISLPLAVGGLWIGVTSFHNLVAAILLAMIGILLPEQIAYAREKGYREKVTEQLGTAVRMFAAEYTETPNAMRAIGLICPRLPEPIGEIFRRADRGFTTGNDVNRVLIDLAKKLNSEYGRLFVQLLRISFEDSAVSPMFTRLATRLAGQQKLIRKNRVEVTAERVVSMGLNVLVVPAYLFASRVMPESPAFFANTATGRVIIVFCLVSVIVGIVMDRVLGQGGELA